MLIRAAYGQTHSPSQLAWSEGRRPLGTVLHSSNELKLSFCLCHNDSIIITIIIIIIMIIISIFFIIIIVDIDTATWEVESTFTVGTPEMTFRLIFLKGQ